MCLQNNYNLIWASLLFISCFLFRNVIKSSKCTRCVRGFPSICPEKNSPAMILNLEQFYRQTLMNYKCPKVSRKKVQRSLSNKQTNKICWQFKWVSEAFKCLFKLIQVLFKFIIFLTNVWLQFYIQSKCPQIQIIHWLN